MREVDRSELLARLEKSIKRFLAELLVRDYGIAFVLRVLVEMWSMVTNYDDPDWPTSESRLSIWLFAIADGDGDVSSINDASVSYAKATRTMREATSRA